LNKYASCPRDTFVKSGSGGGGPLGGGVARADLLELYDMRDDLEYDCRMDAVEHCVLVIREDCVDDIL